MQENILKSIEHHFDTLADPREEERIAHKLIDVLVITICVVVGRSQRLGRSGRFWRG